MSETYLGGSHSHVAQQQTRRGREHLVDWERSEPIYLVIRDRNSYVTNELSDRQDESLQTRRGREHLVDWERSEPINLGICDRNIKGIPPL